MIPYGRSLMQPIVRYYIKLFKSEQSYCSYIEKIPEAVEISNSIILSGVSDTYITTKLHYLVDTLTFFEYD